MKLTKQLLYALLIGIVFVLTHMLIVHLRPGREDEIMLMFMLITMTLAQIAAYLLLKCNTSTVKFGNIFFMLCIIQAMSIILLSLNYAYNPYVEHRDLKPDEILVSLGIFAIVLPLIVTSVIWFTSAKKALNKQAQ